MKKGCPAVPRQPSTLQHPAVGKQPMCPSIARIGGVMHRSRWALAHAVLHDVDVVLDVPPHAARTIATTTSAPSTRRRLANFDVMVFSSQVSDSDTRTL